MEQGILTPEQGVRPRTNFLTIRGSWTNSGISLPRVVRDVFWGDQWRPLRIAVLLGLQSALAFRNL